jgi:hypothetical protein
MHLVGNAPGLVGNAPGRIRSWLETLLMLLAGKTLDLVGIAYMVRNAPGRKCS